MNVPHPVPYQGSKRKLAAAILAQVPNVRGTLYEPFCGSCAVSLHALQVGKAARVSLHDNFAPLMELWQQIMCWPLAVANAYATHYAAQRADPEAYYYSVRESFNTLHAPADLIFLLTRCVKNSVRFNNSGEFNQSPDRRRLGTQPVRMRANLLGASSLLSGRTRMSCSDWEDSVRPATSQDLVYLDPPYQGTSGLRDRRYRFGLDLPSFVDGLDRLLVRGVPVIVSFDGRCGTHEYGADLPLSLGLRKLSLPAGRSCQATLNGKALQTVESLYVSSNLCSP